MDFDNVIVLNDGDHSRHTEQSSKRSLMDLNIPNFKTSFCGIFAPRKLTDLCNDQGEPSTDVQSEFEDHASVRHSSVESSDSRRSLLSSSSCPDLPSLLESELLPKQNMER